MISVITLAELSVGPLVEEDARERGVRQARLQQTEATFEPIPFDANAARAFGRVSASLRRARRTTSARSFDALIAATAIAQGIPLYTANPADFRGIEELDLRTVVARA